jgi:hypothetical protein
VGTERTVDTEGKPGGRARCAVCGQPIKDARGSGSWIHASHAVAACDLDADHEARPEGADWAPPV